MCLCCLLFTCYWICLRLWLATYVGIGLVCCVSLFCCDWFWFVLGLLLVTYLFAVVVLFVARSCFLPFFLLVRLCLFVVWLCCLLGCCVGVITCGVGFCELLCLLLLLH